MLLEQAQRGGRHVGRRRAVAERAHAEALQRGERPLHVRALLVGRLAARVHVRPGVVRHLVAGGEDRLALASNDSIVWPGTKNVAGRPARPRSSSSRGTPTRAPYSPRCNIAGVTCSYPNHTESASKSNVRQTVERGTVADASAIVARRRAHAGPQRPLAAAVVVEGDHIAAVLDEPADARRRAARRPRRRLRRPGLVDAHVHFPSWALGRRELRLFGCASLAEALDRVAAAERRRPAAGCAGAAGATSCGARSRRATRSTRSRRASRSPCGRTTATRCG